MRLSLSLLLVALAASPAAAQHAERTELRQVAGILDYIGSDYAGAVSPDGEVVNELEYREQFALTEDAVELAKTAGLGDDDPVVQGLRALVPMLERRDPPPTVLSHTREIKRTMIREHDLVLEPGGAPDPARAQELYFAHGCQTCHGDDGGADTPQARELDPPPADFLDPERVAGVSPHRAYYAISYGVDGTGMTAYDQLSEEERWSLAFWVLSLRHRESDPSVGQRLLEARGGGFDASARSLSHMTDDDLREAMGARFDDPEQAAAAVTFLRASAPFRQGGAGDFEVARERLAEGLSAYRDGKASDARTLFISAYLDGFEPQEAGLRARDADLVNEIEREMLALRESVSDGAPVDEVERRVATVSGLLDRADGGEASVATSFVGSAAISLREGFEAVLLVAALLALVRRRGGASQAKWVHAGWLAALPAGFLTWLVAGEILGGLERELAEGVVALAAAVVLLGVTHWIVGQATSRKFMGAVADKIGQAASGRGARWGVFFLAFIAVYREAFEVVLFYKAMLLDAGGHGWVVVAGAATGLTVLAILALLLKRVGQRLKPRPFMLASGAVLALLAVVLVGKGVRALQEAGVVGTSVVGIPDVPTIGLFGSVQGLAAQGVLIVLLLGSVAWPWLRARREDRSSPSPAE